MTSAEKQEVSWYVAVAGGIQGPLTRSEIFAQLSSGKLQDSDPVCEVGTQEWITLGSVQNLRRQQSMFERRARRVLGSPPILAAIVGVIAVASLGGFLFRRARREASAILSLDVRKLPPGTKLISQSQRVRGDDIPTHTVALLAAAFSDTTVCGGPSDPANAVALARGKSLREIVEQELFSQTLQSEAARSAVKCGYAIARTLLDPRLSTVTFTYNGQDMVVSAVRSNAADLPLGARFIRHSFGGLPGYCEHTGSAWGCKEGGVGIFRIESNWIFGSIDDAEAFARSYTSADTEPRPNPEIISELMDRVEPTDGFVELIARPDTISWVLPCLSAAPFGESTPASPFMEACAPRQTQQAFDAIEDKARGAIVQDKRVVTSHEIYERIVVLAYDSEGAQAIQRNVEDLARDWRDQVENHEIEISKIYREHSTYNHDRIRGIVQDAFFRAIKGVTVSRSGLAVTLKIEEKLNEQELRQLNDFVATGTVDQQATESIVNAMNDGAPIPTASLANFIGLDAATWFALPQASENDCAAFSQKLQTLSTNLPVQLFGLKFQIQRRFETNACVGQAMPGKMVECVRDASTLQALDRCRFTDRPDVQLAKAEVYGRWQTESVSGGTYSESNFYRSLQWQTDADRFVYRFGGMYRSTPLDVALGPNREILLQWPSGTNDTSTVTAQLTQPEAGKLTFKSGSLVVTFGRGKFTEDLFAAAATAAAAREAAATAVEESDETTEGED